MAGMLGMMNKKVIRKKEQEEKWNRNINKEKRSHIVRTQRISKSAFLADYC